MMPRMIFFISTAMVLVLNCRTIDGIYLDCSYQMISFRNVGSSYTCVARVLFDGTEAENVRGAFGAHQPGRGHADVQGLRVDSQSLTFFPTDIEIFFPNIIAINLRYCNIITVSNRHLAPFPNLQHLSLAQNTITSIDGDIFTGMHLLSHINLGSNHIRHVGHDLNLPIDGQVSVHFTNNPCISAAATTPDQVLSLKLNLLRSCPPTISQIEDSLERRPNLITHVDSQVQNLTNVVDGLMNRIAYLESLIIGNGLEARPVGNGY